MEDRFRLRAFYNGKVLSVDCLDNEFDCVSLYDKSIEVRFNPQLSSNKVILMQCTGLKDKNGTLIYEGDVVRLELENEEDRHFVVSIKTVTREVVSHPDFDDPTANVAITGVVFEWEGYELFPCIDENGVPDNEKMEIVGNVYEHPELLEG